MSPKVISKIAESLERSSFGSGKMIAEILMDPDFQMPCETSVWDIELVMEDGDYYFYYSKRRDFYMGGPTWQTRVMFSINICDETIEFLLGCGIHSASCIFNKASGDLIEVIPDGLPSNSFWGDGDHPEFSLRARREFLKMTGKQ